MAKVGVLVAVATALVLMAIPAPPKMAPAEDSQPESHGQLFVQLPNEPFVEIPAESDGSGVRRLPVPLQSIREDEVSGSVVFYIEDEEGAAVFLDVPNHLIRPLMQTALRAGYERPSLY